MPTRAKRLLAVTAAATGVWTTGYTTPPDRVTIVKDLRFVNRSAATRTMRYSVFIPGFGRVTLAIRTLTTLTDAGEPELWVVLMPGDTLDVFTDGASTDFHASGSELVPL